MEGIGNLTDQLTHYLSFSYGELYFLAFQLKQPVDDLPSKYLLGHYNRALVGTGAEKYHWQMHANWNFIPHWPIGKLDCASLCMEAETIPEFHWNHLVLDKQDVLFSEIEVWKLAAMEALNNLRLPCKENVKWYFLQEQLIVTNVMVVMGKLCAQMPPSGVSILELMASDQIVHHQCRMQLERVTSSQNGMSNKYLSFLQTNPKETKTREEQIQTLYNPIFPSAVNWAEERDRGNHIERNRSTNELLHCVWNLRKREESKNVRR